MTKLASIDLIVPDVLAAARLLTDAFNATPHVMEADFAEVELGGMTFMFSRTALVPTQPAAGIILHLEVPDPQQAADQAQAAGAELRHPFTQTPWGTESVMLAGPADITIDYYRTLDQNENTR